MDLYGYPSLHDVQSLDVKTLAVAPPASSTAAAAPQQAAGGSGGHEEDWLAELVAAGLLHVADSPVDVGSHMAQAVR